MGTALTWGMEVWPIMSTTIREVFAGVNLRRQGVVQWGTVPQENASGVYVVSLATPLAEAPLAACQFEKWLDDCPQLTLDWTRPNPEQLMHRIRRFWISDEVILYIGKADKLSRRLRAYYDTPIGAS